MNLLFFQNIISPHQMPYIQHLPKMEGVEQVVVIVPEVNLEERDSLGWNTEKWLQTEGVQFLVAPTEEEVERVLNGNETLRYETLRYETLRYETLRYETLRYETLRYENQNENGNVNETPTLRNTSLRNADATKTIDGDGNGNVLCKQSEQARANETPTLRKATGRRTKFGNDTSLRNADATKTIDGNGNVTWCLFSGINAFPEVAKWFRMSLKYNVRRGVITEPPYVYDHPLWQHAIRFALKDWRYVKYIDKIFVMGEDYLNYYRFWSKRWEVIPFMYCTEGGNVNGNVLCKQSEQARANVNETLTLRKATGRRTKFGNDTALRNVACGYYENQKENGNGDGNENQNQNENGERVRVVYVGSLSHRKNVGCLLKAAMLLSKEEQEQLEIGIVGDGDEREALERLADGLVTPVRFYGTQPMGMIPDIMGQYDVLVLPSLHDGWGAVVNEALMLGLYVICSDHCGAKYLLKNPKNGTVFESNDAKDFMFKLRDCIKQKNELRAEKRERIQWSKIHISGEAVASYFLSKIIKDRKTGALRA